MLTRKFANLLRTAGLTSLVAASAIALSSAAMATTINFGDFTLGGSDSTAVGVH